MSNQTNIPLTGAVKWYQPQRGYGWIAGNDGVDYYVNYRQIQMDGFRKLKRKQRVSFCVGKPEKGHNVAVDVCVLPNDEDLDKSVF